MSAPEGIAPGRAVEADAGQDAVYTRVGGVCTPGVLMAGPVARLAVFPWGIRLEGRNRLVRAFVPTWEARFEELAPVRLVHFSSRPPSHLNQVRFAILRDHGRWLVFGTLRAAQVLDAIEAAGGPVERAPARVYRFDPGTFVRR